MMPDQPAANRFKELCAEYHARPKVRHSDFDDFLVEKIEQLHKTNTDLMEASQETIRMLVVECDLYKEQAIKLATEVERLKEEIAKKPLGQWCDRSENERLREEKAVLLTAVRVLENSHAHLFSRCDQNPSHFDSYDVNMAEARAASRCAHAAITKVIGDASPDPLSSADDEEPA